MASIQCHNPCNDQKTNYHEEIHYEKTIITEEYHDNKSTSHDHKQHSFTEKVKDIFNHHDDHHKSKDSCSTGTAHHGLIRTEKKHEEQGGHWMPKIHHDRSMKKNKNKNKHGDSCSDSSDSSDSESETTCRNEC